MSADLRRLAMSTGIVCFCLCVAVSVARAAAPESDPVKACPDADEFYRKKSEAVSQIDAARKPPLLAELRRKLLAWEKSDQQVRKEITAEMMADPVKSAKLARRLRAVDERNYRRIKSVVDEYGFPTKSMVAPDGAGAAFVLVQHQDRHPEFQQFVLSIMTPWVKRGEVDGESLALLTDRILVTQKKPQRYGSQFRSFRNDLMEMQPVEDPEHLDERRVEAGLPPMAVYRCIIEQMYHTSVKQ